MSKYHEQFNAHKIDILNEMDQLLERHKLPKLAQQNISAE